jgi:hypothetical protein
VKVVSEKVGREKETHSDKSHREQPQLEKEGSDVFSLGIMQAIEKTSSALNAIRWSRKVEISTYSSSNQLNE